MILDSKLLLEEIDHNLQLAFPDYNTGFWRQSNAFPFHELDSNLNLGIFQGIPSSDIPFPLAAEGKSRWKYKNGDPIQKQVIESAAKLNIDRAMQSATTMSAIQTSDLMFKPQNDRLSFSKTDSPLGKFVTLR